MNRPNEIRVPGAPMPPTESEGWLKAEQLQEQLDAEKAAHELTQRQLVIARQARPQGLTDLQVYEPETEHGRAAKAASTHSHMTADECLRAGVSRVVMAKDGWFVPPVLHTR